MTFLEKFSNLFVYDPQSPLLFNSGTFMILFVLFAIIYTLIYKKRLVFSLYVIAFSLFFYYKSSGIYFLILVLTTVTDYSFAVFLDRAKKKFWRVTWMLLGIVPSMGLLAYFKYTNFILFNWSLIIQNNFQPLDIFLPVGISFYTFQSVSYILDVYWGKLKPTKSILDYAFFLSFFPQLVAGPIVKAHHFLPQLENPPKVTKDDIYAGVWLILIGVIKKAVIADYISQYNDLIFASPDGYNGFENLMAVYGYTLQIYCDFSGYSDMAIGFGKMLGYDLGVNFRLPYQAMNITEFWRRWHISLSSWLRDYIYIPLGGNRKGKFKQYRNLMLTMLIGGLWHGANWKFVFWGGMHGIGLAVHKFISRFTDKIKSTFASRFFAWFITFHFVIFLWIFFRATDITRSQTVEVMQNGVKTEVIQNVKIDAFIVSWMMIKQIITNTDFSFFVEFWKSRYLFVILMLIGFTMHITPLKIVDKLPLKFAKLPFTVKLLVFIIVVQIVLNFKNTDVQPFIYFQF